MTLRPVETGHPKPPRRLKSNTEELRVRLRGMKVARGVKEDESFVHQSQDFVIRAAVSGGMRVRTEKLKQGGYRVWRKS